MKKVPFIVYVIALFILSSCSSSYYSENVYTLDYGKYAEKGFIIITHEINPVSTGHKFIPISEISISFVAGKKISDDLKNKNGIKNKEHKTGTYSDPTMYYYATKERVFDKLIEESKMLGANGIVNFHISPNGQNWVVSGTAVRFND